MLKHILDPQLEFSAESRRGRAMKALDLHPLNPWALVIAGRGGKATDKGDSQVLQIWDYESQLLVHEQW